MALSAGTVYEVRSTATSGNVNGGGFNPANPNGLTNLTTTAGTGNTSSPVVSSASYNFVAGDVNAWLYIQGGTNWTPGWYQIASVATNKATLSAGVGQAILVSNGRFVTNTVTGCATTGTPTGGIFMVDYSQQNAAQAAFTSLKCTSASTTLTDNLSGNKFTKVMVGNLVHITAGTNFTPGWYEIISWTNANNVVLDSSPAQSGVNATSGTGKVGGAISLGATGSGIGDQSFSALSPSTQSAQTNVFIKGNATYSPAEGIGGFANWEGYSSIRGDRPTGSARPTINSPGSATFEAGPIRNLIITGLGLSGSIVNTLVLVNSNQSCEYCKIINTNTALSSGVSTSQNSIDGTATVIGCEISCYRGAGIDCTFGFFTIIGNYIHDCDVGILTNDLTTITDNIVCCCTTAAIKLPASQPSGGTSIIGNTLYGAENKLGTGLSFLNTTVGCSVMNNILYGFATASAAALRHSRTIQTTTTISTILPI